MPDRPPIIAADKAFRFQPLQDTLPRTAHGMPCALAHCMAKKVGELKVYQKALDAAHIISDILKRPAFQADRELSSQLNGAFVRVVSDIAEGV